MTFLRTIHICEEEQFVEPGIMLGKGEYYQIPTRYCIRLYFPHAESHIETWAVLMPPLLVGFWDWWMLSNLCMVSAVTWQNWDRNSDVLYPKPFQPLLLLFSHSVLYDSLQSHGLQGARLPCPSPTPGACSSSCPLSRWCHPTISSSVVLFSSCLQSFPASGSFPMSRLFTSGGQNIRALVSASVLSMNVQDWFPSRLTGLISLQSKGLSRVLSNTTIQKHQFFGTQPSLSSISHLRTWLLEKP